MDILQNQNDSCDLETEKYKRILENMAESVWMWDAEEKTLYANPNFCNLLWYTLDEMIGRKSYDFRDFESIKTVKGVNLVRKEWVASKYQWVLKAKDGTLIPVFCSWTPIPWGGTVGILTDLRELKSLQEVEEKLKKLNKNKDEFISIVWHELRTPLTAIKWYLSMILDGDMWEIGQEMKKALTHTYTSTNRLIELVNDMLCVAKIESGNMVYYMEWAPPIEIIQSVYQDVLIDANRKKLQLHVSYTPKILETSVWVDSSKLAQILINLATNAIKFTNEGGSITLGAQLKNGRLEFSVQDTWIWIPIESQKNLFEKFTQVESALQRKNTSWLGLWLSIAKEFVIKFWWILSLESKVSEGSRFYFSLPYRSSKVNLQSSENNL